MPFTVAHTVAARPLWRMSRRRLLLSAVVVGSVAPDLEYLVHLQTERTIGHTLWGAFVLDLPVALVVLALWHGVVKQPVAALLSPGILPPIDTRPFPFAPMARFLRICGSILLGVAGHLLWDSFTHRGGFITTRVGLLMESIGRPHVYDLLNYASSALGMALLGVWWWRAASTPSPRALLADQVRHPAVIAIALVTAAGGVANGLRARLDGWGPESVLVDTTLGAMAAGALAVLVVSVLLRPRVP